MDTTPPGAASPRRGNRFAAALARRLIRGCGWRIEGAFPNIPKCVVIVAPHTSNWDFLVGLATMYALDLRIDWLGKHSLFRAPLAGLLRWLGGIPVDRHAPQGLVSGIAEVFRSRERLFLCITPEGTRRKVAQWKSGFYRIAEAGRLPIVPVAFDYARRVVSIMPQFFPTGDYAADLPVIQSFFAGIRARRPAQALDL